MDSDDDFQQFSPSTIASPFIPERKLKRLKKSILVSEDSVRTHFQSDALELSTSNVDSEDSNVSIVQELEETNESWERRLAAENKLNSVHDGKDVECRVGAKRALDFLSAIEDAENRGDEEDMEDKEDYVLEKGIEDQNPRVEEESGDSRVDGFDKDRLILDVFEKEKEKNINKRNKGEKNSDRTGHDRTFTATTSKIKEKKGRKELITELRAESQKLLRETRDASFKPIPMVAKSVSSVLEKIRKRKLELSKKSVVIDYSVIDNYNDDDLLESLVLEHNLDKVGSEKLVESMNEETVKPLAFAEDQINTTNVGGLSYEKNKSKDGSIPSCRHSDEESKQPFRPPFNDTQELFSNSQFGEDDEISVESPNHPQEEFLAPSILTMKLKLDSAPPDYESDEEENNKENVDPCHYRLADPSSSPIGDPVKAFVDDEAEEEDDSDNDMRFQDSEEEEDTDIEELNDMIATGYKEKPIDNERRNQLHQKWLENQDNAGTEKLMQKLKCGSKLIKQSLSEDEAEDEEEEDENDVFDNEATEDSLQPSARLNLRKMKEMVAQMFTDADDTYFSDDEETERRLAQQCLVEKAGETLFKSPADDESCREVFGLIKKLNIVPETKKKTTLNPFSSAQLPGGNKNISSKPSFLGRNSNQSLASSKKHGSSNSRSFIFERDESSSRSETTIAEETHDELQKENKPARIGPARPSFSQSQAKSSTQMLSASQPSSGISLFEILRQSSLRSKQCSFDNISYQSESVFEAFKLDKAPAKKRVKMEGRR